MAAEITLTPLSTDVYFQVGPAGVPEAGWVHVQVTSSEPARLSLELEVEQDIHPAPNEPAVATRTVGSALTAELELVPDPAEASSDVGSTPEWIGISETAPTTSPWTQSDDWTRLGPASAGKGWARFERENSLPLQGDFSSSELILRLALPGPRHPSAGRVRMRARSSASNGAVSPWIRFDPARQDRWTELLPSIYRAAVELQPNGSLSVLLKAMDGMLAPMESAIADFPRMLDQMRTREDFVPMLSAWLAAGSREGDALPPNREWTARLRSSRGVLQGSLVPSASRAQWERTASAARA